MDESRLREEFGYFALNTILENTADLIYFKDRSLRYMHVSKAFAALTGSRDACELYGKTDQDLFSEEEAARYAEADRKVLETGMPSSFQLGRMTGDEQHQYSSVFEYPVCDDKGHTIGVYGIGRDVTAQAMLEKELGRWGQPTRALADVMEADISENRILHLDGTVWSTIMAPRTEGSFSDLVKSAAMLAKEECREELFARYSLQKLQEDYKNGIRQFSHIVGLHFGEKRFRWIEFTAWLYRTEFNGNLRLMLFLRDMDEEIRKRMLLRHKAEVDPLTGVLNRKSAMEQIEECILGYGAEGTHALLFIDLDFFKQVNDRKGHPYGDQVLRETAAGLRELFRGTDVVGRMGGDEFIVFLKNISSREAVERKIQAVFNAPAFCQGRSEEEPPLGCSVGVAFFRGGGKSFGQLYEEADKAMYTAKMAGKCRVAFFEDGIR
ncbi:MAG: GGDEF domain-containing protein [Clostridiaceae bacterium]|nr:GGDEF domain-containing protein [Clostridiaceae bacterium]